MKLEKFMWTIWFVLRCIASLFLFYIFLLVLSLPAKTKKWMAVAMIVPGQGGCKYSPHSHMHALFATPTSKISG